MTYCIVQRPKGSIMPDINRMHIRHIFNVNNFHALVVQKGFQQSNANVFAPLFPDRIRGRVSFLGKCQQGECQTMTNTRVPLCTCRLYIMVAERERERVAPSSGGNACASVHLALAIARSSNSRSLIAQVQRRSLLFSTGSFPRFTSARIIR